MVIRLFLLKYHLPLNIKNMLFGWKKFKNISFLKNDFIFSKIYAITNSIKNIKIAALIKKINIIFKNIKKIYIQQAKNIILYSNINYNKRKSTLSFRPSCSKPQIFR